MKKTTILISITPEFLKVIDEKAIEYGKQKKGRFVFDRSEYICFALSEYFEKYMKLPSITRSLISNVRNDFKR